MKKGEGPIDKWRLYNNEKVIPNFKIYYTETNWLPRVISITIIQLLRVLILSRVCFVSLSILASVYHAHAIFQIWWEVKTRLVAFQRHKVALDIGDMDEVLQWCSAAASLALVPLRLRIVVNSINNILHYLYIITSRGLFLFRCSQCMLKQGGAQRVMMKFHFLRLVFQRVRTHLTSDPIAAIDVLNSSVFFHRQCFVQSK